MGCDIHVFLERRYAKGPWQLDPMHKHVTYNGRDFIVSIATFSGRNYDFFGRVAGVRSMNIPVVSPRGLPDDMCQELKANFDSSHHHTPTWLSPKEMQKAMKKFEADYKSFWDEYDNYGSNWLWSGAPELTFKEDHHGIDNSALLYIAKELAIHDIDKKLLNDKRKLEFRFIIWFDS